MTLPQQRRLEFSGLAEIDAIKGSAKSTERSAACESDGLAIAERGSFLEAHVKSSAIRPLSQCASTIGKVVQPHALIDSVHGSTAVRNILHGLGFADVGAGKLAHNAHSYRVEATARYAVGKAMPDKELAPQDTHQVRIVRLRKGPRSPFSLHGNEHATQFGVQWNCMPLAALHVQGQGIGFEVGPMERKARLGQPTALVAGNHEADAVKVPMLPRFLIATGKNLVQHFPAQFRLEGSGGMALNAKLGSRICRDDTTQDRFTQNHRQNAQLSISCVSGNSSSPQEVFIAGLAHDAAEGINTFHRQIFPNLRPRLAVLQGRTTVTKSRCNPRLNPTKSRSMAALLRQVAHVKRVLVSNQSVARGPSPKSSRKLASPNFSRQISLVWRAPGFRNQLGAPLNILLTPSPDVGNTGPKGRGYRAREGTPGQGNCSLMDLSIRRDSDRSERRPIFIEPRDSAPSCGATSIRSLSRSSVRGGISHLP